MSANNDSILLVLRMDGVRFDKILFHLNFSNDHVLALLSLILKGIIYGETQREEQRFLMELLFSSSTKGPLQMEITIFQSRGK